MGIQIQLELIRKLWSDTNITRKLLTGKPKYFRKSNPWKQVFLHTYADLWCCFDPGLMHHYLPQSGFTSDSVPSLSCLSVSSRQWSYLTAWLLTLLNLPGSYLQISLAINLFATLNQHWIKWRHEPNFSINKVQEPYTGWGEVILLINPFFSSLFQNL